MCTLDELTTLGWCISQKTFSEQLQKVEGGNRQALLTHLLDADLREFGAPWIADHRKQDQLDAGGRIVQLVRSRNIAIPQVDEDHVSVSGSYSGPRLLRLVFTDGRTNITALDVDNHEELGMNTHPGTKIRLMGTIPLCLGFLILRKQHVKILGGKVTNLIKEWTMTKMAKDCEGRLQTGAPPFVAFGSREASDLVKSESKFLASLNAQRNRPDAGYDSFKIASKYTAAEKESEFDSVFIERRQDIIKEVQQANVVNQSTDVSTRFQTGGSKFADLQAEKAQAYDEALAQLVSLNYPPGLAVSALKLHKGDYKAALDYLLSKQTATTKLNGPGSKRRGGRSGRRGIPGGPDDEDDPRFDPAAAAAAAGLPSRSSTGLTRLCDLLPSSPSTRVGMTPPTQNPGPSASTKASSLCRLPVGCPILAQNMAGEYEEAQLLGHISLPGATASGDKVVLVVYTQRSNGGPHEDQEELVPLSLIRTLNNEKVSLDMVPPAPSERARAYSLPVNSPGAPDYSASFGNSNAGYARASSSRGRFGRSGGYRAGSARFNSGRPRRAFGVRST